MNRGKQNKRNGGIDQELVARKRVLIDRLAVLFASVDAHLEPISALAELNGNGKGGERHHVDCQLILASGETYYFTFGYKQVRDGEHPFFIRILESWFDGTKLIAREQWLHTALLQVMNLQGDLRRSGNFRVKLNHVETPLLAAA